MSLQAYLANEIERIADSMSFFVENTKPSVLSWRAAFPGSDGIRTIFEQVAECIVVNLQVAAKLSGADPEEVIQPEFEAAETCSRQIRLSANTLATVILRLSDNELAKEHPHRGGHYPGPLMIQGAYRNMAYHCGQINLIQMLAGDAEFHRPPSWYGPARDL